MPHHHHPIFVGLSLLVAVFGSWTALDLFGRVRSHIGRAQQASERMSVRNPTRQLLREMAVALVAQARLVADLSERVEDKPRIVLP